MLPNTEANIFSIAQHTNLVKRGQWVEGCIERRDEKVNDKRCTQGRNRQMKPREIITNNIIQETVQHKTGGKDSVKCDVM